MTDNKTSADGADKAKCCVCERPLSASEDNGCTENICAYGVTPPPNDDELRKVIKNISVFGWGKITVAERKIVIQAAKRELARQLLSPNQGGHRE